MKKETLDKYFMFRGVNPSTYQPTINIFKDGLMLLSVVCDRVTSFDEQTSELIEYIEFMSKNNKLTIPEIPHMQSYEVGDSKFLMYSDDYDKIQDYLLMVKNN